MPYGKSVLYEKDKLRKAIESVKSGQFSIRKASVHYGVPKSTIGDRMSGKTSKLDVGRGQTTALPQEVESNLAKSLIKASQLGVGITRKQLLLRTGALCKRLNIKTPFKNGIPGKDWWQGMKKRHPGLSIRKTEKLGSLRCRMMNREKVSKYFEDLNQVLVKLNLLEKPHLIWNCDENGKSFEHEPVRVIAEKGSKNVVSKTSASGNHVTIMACCNATGYRMPPLLVVEGKTRRSLFGFNTEEAPSGTMWDYQKNGWMDDRIGERWFRDVFLKHCGPERPQLLILDGHSSHETLGIIMEAVDNGIELFCLPPHTTHYLQPLDRSVFGPFNRAYDVACMEFINQHKLHNVNKWTFPALFRTAWESTVTVTNIVSGFRACGIFPFDPNAIPGTAFLPSEITESYRTDNSSAPAALALQPSSSNVATISSAFLPSEVTESSHTANPSASTPLTVHPSSSSVANVLTVFHTAPETTVVSSECNTPFMNTSSAATMFVQLEPDINDPDLKEILNAEVIATADENGVAVIPNSPSWNLEIEDLLLPSLNNSVPSKQYTNTSTKSMQSHRLLTSAEVIQEKRMLIERKEQLEKEKHTRKQKALEKKEMREKEKERKAKVREMKQKLKLEKLTIKPSK